MKKPLSIPERLPKDAVLRQVAQRYPNLPWGAVELLMQIKRVAAEDRCANQETLERYGLSEGKFYVLATLFAQELFDHDAPSPSEIADHLGVTRATITGLLDGLERDGFLERCHDSRDRRALTIWMTDKGRRFLDEYLPQSCLRVETLLAALTQEERQQLIALLSKIEVSP